MSRAELADQVDEVVRLVPAGRVVTYGDVAELLGTGPRTVGRLMACCAPDLPWWRVVSASGQLPTHLVPGARAHWAQEGTPLADGQDRVRVRQARADLARLADAAEEVLGRLPGAG
ncbi:MAG: MGMT family protein [Actinomycetia bacterium]|nr:MGMT family protein [Actinomycetes bacterium]